MECVYTRECNASFDATLNEVSSLNHANSHLAQDKQGLARNAAGSRNALCACGSRRRTKDCCGKLYAVSAPNSVSAIKHHALSLQRRGDFPGAIAGYEQALATNPDDFDAAHMRAVSLYQLGCLDESCHAFFDLVQRGHVLSESAWHNFGLVVAGSVQWADDADLIAKLGAYRDAEASRLALETESDQASVSVVLASYNHAAFVEEAISSVLAQTVSPLELIVIDDGSSDDSARRIESLLRDASFPVELVVRPNKGASQTFNEAISRAKGDWILPLNSDDRFALDRIEALKRFMGNPALSWGYGQVSCIDANGRECGYARDSREYALRAVGNASYLVPTTGLSFLLANPAISTGNLFFRKSLWSMIGGFRDWRYHHDWHFALSATQYCEPIVVPQAGYDYRIHEKNTIAETRERVQAECRAMMRSALAELCAFVPTSEKNQFAPCPNVWKRAFFGTVGGVGFLELLPPDALRVFMNTVGIERTL